MAINSSTSVVDLDFDTIKSNLKTYLKSQSIIRDYDFEGSNINVLLDVMAYNTYLNNFYTNMLSNEMFLSTAQLRDSIVAHAKELNYIPRSTHGAVAYINIQLLPNDAPSSITINKYTKFNTTVGGKSLVFSTEDDHVVKPSTASNGQTVYLASNVAVYEGKVIEEFNTVNSQNNFSITVSNKKADMRHLTLNVRESASSNANTNWAKADTLFGINATSNVFFVQPAKDDKYEVTFGDNVFGRKPSTGNIVKITYRNTNGADGNRAKKFTAANTIGGYSSIVTTVTDSTGGKAQESVDEIKFNAPKAFQVQERAVTANDYKILIQREFPEVKNILAFGGEELEPPRFGKVIIAVDLADADGVPESKRQAIQSFLSKRSPVGIDPLVVVNDFTFLEVTADISYNVSVTTQAPASIISKASAALGSFANSNINAFDAVFRNSKAVAAIDNSDDSIISTQITTRPFKKFTPRTIATTYSFEFNNKLAKDDVFVNGVANEFYTPAITSSLFTVDSVESCFFIDDGIGNLIIVRLNNASKYVLVRGAAGTVNYDTGKIDISSISIPSFQGTTMKLFARTTSKDIKTKKASILQLNTEDSTFNITQERL